MTLLGYGQGNGREIDVNDISTDRTRLFGPFRLSLRQQTLFEGDRRLPLKGRALDVLLALTKQPGELLSKAELLAKVWPDVHVDEAALRVHIAAIRKLLGPGPDGGPYITNVAGRGYKFVGELVETLDALSGAFSPDGQTFAGFRRLDDRIIGRATVVRGLVEDLPSRRFITIAGPGGMGKTTVALSIAAEISGDYRDGIHFVDLTTLSDATLVMQKVASSLRLQGLSFQSEVDLVASVRDWQMLLILDNCEHLLEPVAALAERILEGAPGVHLLATSREPLRASGEYVYRLLPLDLPPREGATNSMEILGCSSVILFLERARAANLSFVLAETDIPSLVEICHRLDGIPLAIELAAARIDFIGVEALAKLLNESFNLLTSGRRTALPRQRTLRATLDWSYNLLAQNERTLLQRLAVFRGSFTLDAAVAVAGSQSDHASLFEGVAALVAKSLVLATPESRQVRYRLLETTRTYALEKLAEAGDADDIQLKHADYFHSLLRQAEIDWPEMSQSEWLGIYSHVIADVRVAIFWLLTRAGLEVQGVALAALASVLWFALGVMEDYRGIAERALAVICDRGLDHKDNEMRLNAWLAAAIYATLGPVPRMKASYSKAAELAVALGNPEYQLYALWGLAAFHNISGEYEEHLRVCRQFDAVTTAFDVTASRLVSDRIMASALYFEGQLAEARVFGERALQTAPLLSRSITKRFHEFDHHLASRVQLSRILWLQGFAGRANTLVREAVAQADFSHYSPAACFLLAYAACPIALWSGDLLAAGDYLAILTTLTANRPQNYWRGWRECYSAAMTLKPENAGHVCKDSLAASFTMIAGPVRLEMAATLREELVGPVALARADASRMLWCAPEILRAHAKAILKTESAEARAEANELLTRSLAIAQDQGSLAWQLRTATTLALNYQSEDRHRDAKSLLEPIYGQFSEGFETADLRLAESVLASL